MPYRFDNASLRSWFEREKRVLPWRENPTPYAVWVSEIMLQQTQVSVVIPYFRRWMELFPTVKALAEAPSEAVIKAWEGLGYYSRARHLHAGARQIIRDHQGILPCDPKILAKIKGIGPYTIGAIRSFAYNQRAAAVDGNVLRVLSRYFCIQDDFSKIKTVKATNCIAEHILPENEPWIISEALIELGATICSKIPKCHICPLNSSCLAYSHGNAEKLPYKSKKTKIEKLYRAVAVIRNDREDLLVKCVEPGNIMSGLYEFPYFESAGSGIDHKELKLKIQAEFGLKTAFKKALNPVQHSFTKYSVTLFPILFSIDYTVPIPPYYWLSPQALQKVAFSSGHRRILTQVIPGIERKL